MLINYFSVDENSLSFLNTAFVEGQPDNDKSTTKTSEFPLLVVESVNSKPIRKSIIAENEEVQQLVENSLKARGKWELDDSVEEVILF